MKDVVICDKSRGVDNKRYILEFPNGATRHLVSSFSEYIANKEINAVIYTVGKVFEENPKAVHIHAEIKDNKDGLIPGIYIKGSILINSDKVDALPEDALVRDGKDFFAFVYEGKDEGHVQLRKIKVLITIFGIFFPLIRL